MSRTAVVVALDGPTPGLGPALARFADEAGPEGEVVLVDAWGDPRVGRAALGLGNLRVLPSPGGRLVPALWRDGLLATVAPFVAFSTARMAPCRGWLAALLGRLQDTGAAGVGGPIAPASGLSATDRAVALLRYSGYFPPLPGRGRVEPPGENALYRRSRLIEVADAWADGFWEADVHRALRGRGESLAEAEDAVVTFQGGVAFRPMVERRWAHARRYGAGRSTGLGRLARLARVASCPLVPPLLIGRAAWALRSRGIGLAPWLPALPRLAVLASAWALGEAAGTWGGPGASAIVEPDRAVSPAGHLSRRAS